VPGTFEAHAARAAVDPDEFDDDAKNGLAIRNACATEGPYRVCGAAVELVVNRAYPALMHLVFEHEDDCPVTRDPYDWREVFTPDEDPPAP
jgi:hypothetical protein